MDFVAKLDGKRQWLQALLQPTTYLGVAMLLAVCVAWSYLVIIDRKEAEREAIRQGENLVRLFESSVSRAFKSADQTVLIFRRSYLRNPNNINLDDWVRDPALKNELTFQFSIIGRDGRITASSYGKEALGIDISKFEHFQVHIDAKDDGLYISQPITLRTSGRRALIFTRRLMGLNGEFDGVVSVSFDIGQLEKYHRLTDLGENGLSTLTGLDGIIRTAGANGRSRIDLIGRNIKKASLFKAFAQSPDGNYWNTSNPEGTVRRLDTVSRLVSYRKIEGFPLIAVIGRSEEVVFQHANANKAAYTIITVVLTVGILIGIAFGAVRQKRLLEAARKITRQAYEDDLTGLANRAAFRQEVDRALEQSNTSGEKFNILMLDLDHFKSVNDTLGHAAGDNLIKQVAGRLGETVRATEFIARLGGDELAILQRPSGDPREAAIILANRLIDVISEPFDLDGHRAMVETSIGIAQSQSDGRTTDQLLVNADLALYRAKAEGRNTFRLFDREMEMEARARFELEADLRDAVNREEFEVYYQPLINSRGKEICGAEALIRWRHPQQGVLLPNSFVPLAESSGLIVPLGELVLRQACKDAAVWPSHIKVAVNLSPVQFRKGDIVGMVTTALLESKLAPGRLELEITESVLLHKDPMNIAKLHELKSLGVSIVLDGFGTGFSPLTYLRDFPFDKIKIDRSFVADMATRPDCAAIVCAVAGLAKSLNAITTAVGVETMEQFELLRAAGCEQVQGYLFGHPCVASAMQFELAADRKIDYAVA